MVPSLALKFDLTRIPYAIDLDRPIKLASNETTLDLYKIQPSDSGGRVSYIIGHPILHRTNYESMTNQSEVEKWKVVQDDYRAMDAIGVSEK